MDKRYKFKTKKSKKSIFVTYIEDKNLGNEFDIKKILKEIEKNKRSSKAIKNKNQKNKNYINNRNKSVDILNKNEKIGRKVSTFFEIVKKNTEEETKIQDEKNKDA